MDATSSCPLLGGVKASAAARRHLRTVGADWDEAVLGDALLAASELVANAVLHGGDHASLTVHTSADTIRVEVFDSGHTQVRPVAPGGAAPGTAPTGGDGGTVPSGGRGLHIVAAVSERWGVTQLPTGTTVWFEMTPSPAAPRLGVT